MYPGLVRRRRLDEQAMYRQVSQRCGDARPRGLEAPRGLELVKRDGTGEPKRRDPAALVDMILGAVE
jgi:transposase